MDSTDAERLAAGIAAGDLVSEERIRERGDDSEHLFDWMTMLDKDGNIVFQGKKAAAKAYQDELDIPENYVTVAYGTGENYHG